MRLTKKIKLIVAALEDKKGENVLVYDVKTRTPLADYYVIATATNSRQMNALVDNVDQVLSANKLPIHHIEGKGKAEDWILVDAFDVIIHVFSPTGRRSYQLEDLLKESKLIYQSPTDEETLS